MFSEMLSKLSVRIILLLFRVADWLDTAQSNHGLAAMPKGATFLLGAFGNPQPNCGDPVVTAVQAGVSNFVHVLIGVGISISVIGIVVGGLMRATSFGNERRVAMSNTAITCSIVGLVVVILGATVGNSVPAWFGAGGNVAGCQVTMSAEGLAR